MIKENILQVVTRVTTEIETYESDTFSSSGSKITRAEAANVLAILVAERITPGGQIDGHDLTSALADVREAEKKARRSKRNV